jgi:hypothetical protein
MVPTLTWGLLRWNFSFAMTLSPYSVSNWETLKDLFYRADVPLTFATTSSWTAAGTGA